MAVNIIIFLLIIILILIIVNIILISIQTKNIYGGTGPEPIDLVQASTVVPVDNNRLFKELNTYLDELSKIEIASSNEADLLSDDSTKLEQFIDFNEDAPCQHVNIAYVDSNIQFIKYKEINEDFRNMLLNKYFSWNYLHYHFVEILMQIMEILRINTLLECAAGSGIISAFIKYTSNGTIQPIATDSNEEKFKSPYYKILKEDILDSIKNHPSQIVLVSRGRETFMNGMFVKTWIKQNVGKIIVLILISNVYDCEGQGFINILDANYFDSYFLAYDGLLFANNGIHTDNIAIYTKNVLTDEYIDIIDDDRDTSKHKCLKPKCTIM